MKSQIQCTPAAAVQTFAAHLLSEPAAAGPKVGHWSDSAKQADRINLDFVLGNKVMVGTVNANREYFESGVRDMAQAQAEYPEWLDKLLPNPVKGLENFEELFSQLTGDRSAIKVFCEVADPVEQQQAELETVTAA